MDRNDNLFYIILLVFNQLVLNAKHQGINFHEYQTVVCTDIHSGVSL